MTSHSMLQTVMNCYECLLDQHFRLELNLMSRASNIYDQDSGTSRVGLKHNPYAQTP